MDLDHKYRLYCENVRNAADRRRARELFVAAGRPVPAWCEDGERVPDPSAAAEAEDELLDGGPL